MTLYSASVVLLILYDSSRKVGQLEDVEIVSPLQLHTSRPSLLAQTQTHKDRASVHSNAKVGIAVDQNQTRDVSSVGADCERWTNETNPPA